MKKIKNHNKAIILSVAIALIITLTACSNGDSSPNSTFPNIDDAKIPDVLELTVGTLGDCYFSDGITDNPDDSLDGKSKYAGGEFSDSKPGGSQSLHFQLSD